MIKMALTVGSAACVTAWNAGLAAPVSPSVPAISASACAYAFPAAANVATNWPWKAAAWCSSAWYSWPYAPKNCAATADTSSSAAATRLVVGPAAAAFASLSAEPIAEASDAAVVKSWGCVIKLVIGFSLPDTGHS